MLPMSSPMAETMKSGFSAGMVDVGVGNEIRRREQRASCKRERQQKKSC